MSKTIKNFDGWNIIKKETENFLRRSFKNGDIWFTRVGENIGDEEGGKGTAYARPMLVLRKWNKNFCIAIPCTTQKKENKFHIYLGEFEGKKTYAILSQVKATDTKRFIRKIGNITFEKRMIVKKALFDII